MHIPILLTMVVTAGQSHAEAPHALPPILKGVKRILFVGDSLTDGSSYPDYVVNTLNGLFPESGFEIHNAAVAGDTAANVRKRFQQDVVGRAPDLMLLCIGTNDCSGKRPVVDYEADVRFIVSETLKSKSKVMIVLPSPFGKINAAKEKPFQDYLAVLRKVAADNGLPVADAHAEFKRGEKAGREMLGPDGIHHGRHGFEGMARAIMDAFGLKSAKLDLRVRLWPGLLTEWETSSPSPRDGQYSLAEATGWKPYDAKTLMARQPWWNSPFPARGGWMPFDDHNSKQVAYGCTHYDAGKAGRYEMQVGGSPSPQLVWLNGEQVWKSSRPHGYHPNADRFQVHMKKGRNEIVVVSNFMIFVGLRGP